MDLSLNDRQRELIELAGRLGRECFAPRAAGYDSDAQFPHENYEDLHQHGLLGLCIPERFGGLGADYATYCLVGAEIGKHCGATALTYNMHTCTMMWSGNLADDLPMTPAQRERHERRRAVITRGWWRRARSTRSRSPRARPQRRGGRRSAPPRARWTAAGS